MKGSWTKALGNLQRNTGTATTALGNVILNMMVHMAFIRLNIRSLCKMFILGDDNLCLFINKPDISGLKDHIKIKFNMMSK